MASVIAVISVVGMPSRTDNGSSGAIIAPIAPASATITRNAMHRRIGAEPIFRSSSDRENDRNALRDLTFDAIAIANTVPNVATLNTVTAVTWAYLTLSMNPVSRSRQVACRWHRCANLSALPPADGLPRRRLLSKSGQGMCTYPSSRASRRNAGYSTRRSLARMRLRLFPPAAGASQRQADFRTSSSRAPRLKGVT